VTAQLFNPNVAESLPTLRDSAGEEYVAMAVNVFAISGRGLKGEVTFYYGRRVTGTITLDKPNPAGRLRCTIDFTAPSSWKREHPLSALRVVAHWFRDIGGFAAVRKAHVCHIVARLAEGMEEAEAHQAVTAYAASEWHQKRRCWVAIQKFFTNHAGHVEQWLDKAHSDPRLRPPDPDAPRRAEEAKARLDAAEAQRAKVDRWKFLATDRGREYLATPEGQAFLKTAEGQDFLRSDASRTLRSSGVNQ
jgi:hypothetical protein